MSDMEKKRDIFADDPEMENASQVNAEEDDTIEITDGTEEAEAESAEADENADCETEAEETGGSEAEAGTEAGKEQPKKEKKSFFSRKKDKKDEQIEELTDKVKRQLAEFENFRKRTEKEKSAMYEVGARSVIEKILPVVDNFERGLAACPEEEKEKPFTVGMEKVYKQLTTLLEELDVKPIEAVGQPFDPNFHNAVMQDENADAPENTVIEEFQKGYTYRGNVVRYSMVKVSK